MAGITPAQINTAIALATWAACVPTENREQTSFSWKGISKIKVVLEDENMAPELQLCTPMHTIVHCNDAYLAYQQLPYILQKIPDPNMRALTSFFETQMTHRGMYPFKTMLLQGLITPARIRADPTPYCIYDHIEARIHHLPLRRFWQWVRTLYQDTTQPSINTTTPINAADAAAVQAQCPGLTIPPFCRDLSVHIINIETRLDRSIEMVNNKLLSIRRSVLATYGVNLNRFPPNQLKKILVGIERKMEELDSTKNILNILNTSIRKSIFLSAVAANAFEESVKSNTKQMAEVTNPFEYLNAADDDAGGEAKVNTKDDAGKKFSLPSEIKKELEEQIKIEKKQIQIIKETTRKSARIAAAGSGDLVADLNLKLRF